MRHLPPRDPTPLPPRAALKAYLGAKDLLGHPYRLGPWGGESRFGRRGELRCGPAGRGPAGKARHGMIWRGRVWQGRRGEA